MVNFRRPKHRIWFKVTLVAGTQYVFDLVGSSLTDPYLQLFSPTLGLIKFNNDSGDGFQLANHLQGDNQRNLLPGYPRPTVREPVRTRFQATPWPLSLTTTTKTDRDDGCVGGGWPGDRHYPVCRRRRLVPGHAVGGTSYTIELKGFDGGGGTLGSDLSEHPYLALFDEDGFFEDAVYAGGLGGDPLMSFTATSSGNYFVSAEDLYSVGTGSYTLSLKSTTLGDDYSNNTSTTGVLNSGWASQRDYPVRR